MFSTLCKQTKQDDSSHHTIFRVEGLEPEVQRLHGDGDGAGVDGKSMRVDHPGRTDVATRYGLKGL